PLPAATDRVADRRGFEGCRCAPRPAVGAPGPGAGGQLMSKTMAQKIWDQHVVASHEGLPDLLYIDLHLVHEVTSPQAFESLRLNSRPVRRPDLTIATMDHNVPTGDDTPVDPLSEQQLATLQRNCEEFGVPLYATGDGHVIEYAGPAIEALSMESRLTICNMSIEAGARAGLIAPDDVTFAYLRDRPHVPQDFDAAVVRWREVRSDDDAFFDRELEID